MELNNIESILKEVSQMKINVESILKDVVLIGEYDCFYGADVVINGKALSNDDIKKITNDLCATYYENYPIYFKTVFPNKLVIYCCDGVYTMYYDGKVIKT